MPKKIRDGLNEEQKQERIDTMVTLNINLSICHFKREQAKDAIKHAKEAVDLNPNNSKARFRLGLAYKLNNDLELAKENLKEAAKIEPNNKLIRDSYQELVDLK